MLPPLVPKRTGGPANDFPAHHQMRVSVGMRMQARGGGLCSSTEPIGSKPRDHPPNSSRSAASSTHHWQPLVVTQGLRFAPPIETASHPYCIPELRIVDDELHTNIMRCAPVDGPSTLLGNESHRLTARAETCLLVSPMPSPTARFVGVAKATPRAGTNPPLSVRRYDALQRRSQLNAEKMEGHPNLAGGDSHRRGSATSSRNSGNDLVASASIVRHESRAVEDAMLSLDEFDMNVDEKRAYQEFLDENKAKISPTVILGAFRHQMCCNTPLVKQIKKLPLERIESVVRQYQSVPTLHTHAFNALVAELVGPDVRYTESDMLNLFDYFDSTGLGEVSFKDLCNGFVLILSKDGSNLPVIHRCVTLVNPKSQRDTRLLMMTRLELVHIGSVIDSVFSDIVKDAVHATENLRLSVQAEGISPSAACPENAQLRAQEADVRVLLKLQKSLSDALEQLMAHFGCDKKGSFAYNDVRDAVQKSKPIRSVIALMSVPRDKDLRNSFLSQFFRSQDAIDRPPRLPKQTSLLQKHFIKRHLADDFTHFSNSRVIDGDEDDEEGDDGLTQMASVGRLMPNRSVITRKNTKHRLLLAQNTASVELELNLTKASFEHGDPKYFTRHGVLYLKKVGQSPQLGASKSAKESDSSLSMSSFRSPRKGMSPRNGGHAVPAVESKLEVSEDLNAIPVRTMDGDVVRGRYFVEVDRKRLSRIFGNESDEVA